MSSTSAPSPTDAPGVPSRVLDLFAVPEAVRPLPGGQGRSVVAGDLVLSPGRDADRTALLSPVLARLAVALDTSPTRRPGTLRMAMPIPARDGAWVVDGWSASRFEPGTRACRDLDVVLAVSDELHARLRSAVVGWDPARMPPRDRWDRAERAAFDLGAVPETQEGQVRDLVRELAAQRTDESLGSDQLVHRDLAGNVLIDAVGSPVVIDVAPAWRPELWARAVCALDCVLWFGAPADALADWAAGAPRQAMLRAALFRLLSDEPTDPGAYRKALAASGLVTA